MDYCCVCGRKVNHPTKSYHCVIEDNVYHYCHMHSFIGEKVANKYLREVIMSKNSFYDVTEIKYKIDTAIQLAMYYTDKENWDALLYAQSRLYEEFGLEDF